jgi:hypothetical protein
MKTSQREPFTLKGLLESFSTSTGLRVNYKKSCLVPLNMCDGKAQQLAGVFGCKLETLPFTYLGLPLGTTKPRVEHYGFMMSKIERRLTATCNLLPMLEDSNWSIQFSLLFLPMPCALSRSQCLSWNALTEQKGTVCEELIVMLKCSSLWLSRNVANQKEKVDWE